MVQCFVVYTYMVLIGITKDSNLRSREVAGERDGMVAMAFLQTDIPNPWVLAAFFLDGRIEKGGGPVDWLFICQWESVNPLTKSLQHCRQGNGVISEQGDTSEAWKVPPLSVRAIGL